MQQRITYAAVDVFQASKTPDGPYTEHFLTFEQNNIEEGNIAFHDVNKTN